MDAVGRAMSNCACTLQEKRLGIIKKSPFLEELVEK
jgi:hypothetical protein